MLTTFQLCLLGHLPPIRWRVLLGGTAAKEAASWVQSNFSVIAALPTICQKSSNWRLLGQQVCELIDIVQSIGNTCVVCIQNCTKLKSKWAEFYCFYVAVHVHSVPFKSAIDLLMPPEFSSFGVCVFVCVKWFLNRKTANRHNLSLRCGRPFVKRFVLCYRTVVLSVLSVTMHTFVNNSDNADDFPALSAGSFAPDQMAGRPATGRDSCKRGCQLGTVKLFCNGCIANNISEVQ